MKMQKTLVALVALVAFALLLFGCTQGGGTTQDTFTKTNNKVCTQNDKPIIYMFSASFCPHCHWIGHTFDDVVKGYVDQNQIIAYHWDALYDDKMNLLGWDNLLTPQYEKEIPASDQAVFNQFNPQGTIPTFVFGCKYYRIGNAFEAQNDLNAERNEFVKVINETIADAKAGQ